MSDRLFRVVGAPGVARGEDVLVLLAEWVFVSLCLEGSADDIAALGAAVSVLALR